MLAAADAPAPGHNRSDAGRRRSVSRNDAPALGESGPAPGRLAPKPRVLGLKLASSSSVFGGGSGRSGGDLARRQAVETIHAQLRLPFAHAPSLVDAAGVDEVPAERADEEVAGPERVDEAVGAGGTAPGLRKTTGEEVRAAMDAMRGASGVDPSPPHPGKSRRTGDDRDEYMPLSLSEQYGRKGQRQRRQQQHGAPARGAGKAPGPVAEFEPFDYSQAKQAFKNTIPKGVGSRGCRACRALLVGRGGRGVARSAQTARNAFPALPGAGMLPCRECDRAACCPILAWEPMDRISGKRQFSLVLHPVSLQRERAQARTSSQNVDVATPGGGGTKLRMASVPASPRACSIRTGAWTPTSSPAREAA